MERIHTINSQLLIFRAKNLAGWMDGWKEGRMEGRESWVKDCLQQSKIAIIIIWGPILRAVLKYRGSASRPKMDQLKKISIIYSGCPKTGRPVWQTGRFYVRFSDFQFLNVRRPFFISGFQTLSENRTLYPVFRRYIYIYI